MQSISIHQMANRMFYSLAILLTIFRFVENKMDISGPHILIENRALRITCSISDNVAQHDNINPRWFKDSEDVSKLHDFGERIHIETIDSNNWALMIDEAHISDVGNYSCVHSSYSANTTVRTKPILYPFEEFQMNNYKSANIVEGERFSLRCALAKGYERDARLEWFMYREDDADASSSDRLPNLLRINTSDPRITIESNDSDSSVLTINAVGPQDRYFYVCKSYNEIASYNNTILLRVKDKLAALWPFLGIVCEVLILCIIIFVYEKRRVKPDFDEPANTRKDEGYLTIVFYLCSIHFINLKTSSFNNRSQFYNIQQQLVISRPCFQISRS
ncbi:hypothetical protein BLOT_010557 [Blomia tropicalis]|nr:hypothetical protein BLOT_010557 [Blomia tropicalis]